MKPGTLERNWQFRTCYRRGRKIVCDHAVVFYHRPSNETRGGPGGVRFGVVASKRVGNAVKRNRAKRLLRVAARNLAAKLNDNDLWIVLIAKASITSATAEAVRTDVRNGLAAAGLISGDQ